MKMTTITKEIKILDRTLERLKENMRIAADIHGPKATQHDIADLKNLFYILEYIFEENEIDWKK